jgi:cyclophilin family peptidyl-prolyl cis-trans isomerase
MKTLVLLFLFVGLQASLLLGQSKNDLSERMVQIETEFGTIKIKLFNETPLHRDNFIKLTSEGFFKDLLFHRVIKGFMIQGGDPDSKNAEPGIQLGRGNLGYTIPAEINPKFFHRKGVLAAARTEDRLNPEKKSSASQFYIVQGRVFSPAELDTMQIDLKNSRTRDQFQQKLKSHEAELKKLGAEGKRDELVARLTALNDEAIEETSKLPPIVFSEEQRKAYTTIGGYPPLDNNYTVFGEITEGLEVLDKIAEQPTDSFDRPVKDIKFSISILK